MYVKNQGTTTRKNTAPSTPKITSTRRVTFHTFVPVGNELT